MRGGATGSSLGWPFSASGILETSTMTALSRYFVMLGRAIEYKKAALVKEKNMHPRSKIRPKIRIKTL